jgi:hypothetical protein
MRMRERRMAGRVLQHRQLAVELERRGVLRIRHQEREHALQSARRIEDVLGHAQLEPHQLQQVRGLIEALIEPLARFSQAPGVDQLSDAPELRRERQRRARVRRVLCSHSAILAQRSRSSRQGGEFAACNAGGL